MAEIPGESALPPDPRALEWAARLEQLFRHAGEHQGVGALRQIIYQHRLARLEAAREDQKERHA